MFRGVTKQAKILHITEACVLGLLWTRNTGSTNQQKIQTDFRSLDISWQGLHWQLALIFFKLVYHCCCYHHCGCMVGMSSCPQRSNKTLKMGVDNQNIVLLSASLPLLPLTQISLMSLVFGPQDLDNVSGRVCSEVLMKASRLPLKGHPRPLSRWRH